MTESKQKTSSNLKQPQNQLNQESEKNEFKTTTLNYKLYYGGYADIKGFTIALDIDEAMDNLRLILNLYALPCDAEEVIFPDYTLTLTPKEESR